jgi:hypothetical protein
MIIDNLGAVYEVSDEDREYSIAPVDGGIMLYSSFGNQLFSYSGTMAKQELQLAFPDRRAAVRASTHHTRGILNKDKFRASVNNLKNMETLTAEAYEQLMNFIETCNCAPAKALIKLIQQGFGGIADKLDLYEESQVMIDTTQALIDFIQALEE